MTVTVDQIDALLPQTQCTRCGFDGCRPYAGALVEGRTEVNRCPPGGPQTIDALAHALKVESKSLDPECGEHQPLSVAVIDEQWCIGCKICIKACPVDAIVGAPKLLHTVIAEQCTGCELCVSPCPTDCIEMVRVDAHPQHASLPPQWGTTQADSAKRRYQARNQRLVRLEQERTADKARAKLRRMTQAHRRRAVEDAVARVRRRRAAANGARC